MKHFPLPDLLSPILLPFSVQTASIRPLSNSQKLFLQRLMVAHVLTDNDAKNLYNNIRDNFSDVDVPSNADEEEDDDDNHNNNNRDESYMGTTFDNCLGLINASLVPAFNLEISTMMLPPPNDPDNQLSDTSAESTPNSRRKKPALIKYHAIINRSNDTHAKNYASPLVTATGGGSHELAYFRLIFEKLIDKGNDIIQSGSATTSVGCPGVMNRMDLINARTDLEGAHNGKLTVCQTEEALEMLIGEGWLVEMAEPGEDDEQSDNGEGGDEEEDPPKKKHKRKAAGSNSRRKSMKGTYYGIGPRSYMELGEFLKGVGFDGERMPQLILNRL